jgi:hypothetical protein
MKDVSGDTAYATSTNVVHNAIFFFSVSHHRNSNIACFILVGNVTIIIWSYFYNKVMLTVSQTNSSVIGISSMVQIF